jgi:hypothetical protein
VTKLSRIEQQNPDARQAENFRKLIVAMSTDIRVIIVKLADRLHNLETLAGVENPDKRRRALERIAERDPGRAERLAGLRHVLPPRPAGTRALLRGAQPTGAGVVVGWHVGFDGLDTFAGILAALGRAREPIRMRFARVDPPPEDTAAFERWLDELWCGLDRDVEALGSPPPGRTG